MALIKKISVGLAALAFAMTLAVTSGEAQKRKHWHGDNCGHYGNNDRGRRYRTVTYRTSPRYYTTYYPVTQRRYPRYLRSSPRIYNYYPAYSSYRRYPRYRRSGLSINVGFRW